MSREGFLQKAGSTSPFISESKVLKSISEKKKAIVFLTKDLESFQRNCSEVFYRIDKAKNAELTLIQIKDDDNIITRKLDSKRISEAQLLNLIDNCFKDYEGYCFVVNSGVEYLYKDGKINTEVEACLTKTDSMKEKLKLLKPVCELENVLKHFMVDCENNVEYYNRFFDPSSNKVLAEIKEQDLRNVLLDYLSDNIKGDVDVEFCTDIHNDEESVDICVNDGIERAIIEVKFSLPAKYYLGKTHYSFRKRTEDGYIQLDKYAKHLSKDGRMVEYAYLYMFYMNDKDEAELYAVVNDVISSTVVSADLTSVFKTAILNNMKKWIVTT